MPDFKSKDYDYVRIYEGEMGFKYIRLITTPDTCYFDIIKRPKEELIRWALEHGPAMQCGKFLVPEFCEEFDITLDDLKKLEAQFNSMDKKHTYEKIIYNAYIENGSMTLTDDQRLEAYESYKETRKNTKK